MDGVRQCSLVSYKFRATINGKALMHGCIDGGRHAFVITTGMSIGSRDPIAGSGGKYHNFTRQYVSG